MRGPILAALLVLSLAGTPHARGDDPEYPHGEFAGDCTECHSADQWKPVKTDGTWKHPDAFPLRGAHRSASCRACHLTLDFSKAPTDCVACHTDAHRGEMGTDCAVCHTPRNFLDRSAQLDKHRATRFPLIGAHAAQDCEACHTPQPQGALTWVGLPIECVTCHLADYEAAADPNHVQAGFPTECQLCHTPTFWSKARFDHANTRFPLTGAHRNVDCQVCHADGYTGTPSDCFACHENDYRGTTDPDHEVLNFPTDCTACHTTNGWDGAAFTQHDTLTRFPLTGAHRNLDCLACHSSGYVGTPTDCFACHENDYRGTIDPDHELLGFPTDCTVCHTTSGWAGADFAQHDTLYFPIYSGRHNNRWDQCSDCHTQPGNFAVFSCFLCHSSGDTNPRHTGVPDYEYDSNRCLDCHPRGEAGNR